MTPAAHQGDQTAMIEDYVATREDERSFQATQVGLASLALTTLGALAGLIGRYVLGAPKPGDGIPAGLLVLTPLVPLALFAMFAQAGAQATLRTHYMRDLEEQLTEGTSASQTPWVPGAPTPSPSFIRLSGALVGLRHGHRVYRLLTVLLISIAMSAFIVILILIGTHVPGPWAAAMTVGYASAILTLGYLMWTATARGQAFYSAAHKRLAARISAQGGGPDPAAEAAVNDEKRLLSYLLLPRPADLVKSLYYFAGVILAGFLGDIPHRDFAHWSLVAIWGWIVLELLAYQARYQWNDIRGLARDRLHPMASKRRRLPDTEESPQATALFAAWRIAAALVLALGAPEGSRTALLIGIALIFALGAAYETARHQDLSVLVIILVAVGYPLRFCLGLAVAGYDRSLSGLLAPGLGVLAFAALGWSTVGLTWTLEADETKDKNPPTGHHRQLWKQADLPKAKPNPYLPPLKVGYPLWTVPNLAQLVACASVVAMAHLATPAQWSGRSTALMIIATVAMTALMLLGIRGWWTVAAFAGSFAVITAAAFLDAPHPSALWVPALWAVFAGFYLSFRANTYTGLTSVGETIAAVAFFTKHLVGGWIVTGNRTIRKQKGKLEMLNDQGTWEEWKPEA
ncbi:hypothetical protein [Kribbella sp. NPDC000426]|uniref:hypothetical protein n=1 Tax=Kribbella sp. NPDC000426 TaxID=3154255 RepID=UPI0033202AE9